MVASRVRVLRASNSARFWLSAFCIALMPTSVGYQDLAALIAHRPDMSASYGGEHLIASPFGTIERATFNFTRPIGTVIPGPLEFQNINFDPRSLDAYAWKVDEALTGRRQAPRQVEYPTINRTNKGDRLPPPATPAAVDPKTLPQLQPLDAAPACTAADRAARKYQGQCRRRSPRTADVHAEAKTRHRRRSAPSPAPPHLRRTAAPASPVRADGCGQCRLRAASRERRRRKCQSCDRRC